MARWLRLTTECCRKAAAWRRRVKGPRGSGREHSMGVTDCIGTCTVNRNGG